MKRNRVFLMSFLPLFSASLLIGCSNNKPVSQQSNEPPRDPVQEGSRIIIGDTVKIWKDERYCNGSPIGFPGVGGETVVIQGFGVDDYYSIQVNANGTSSNKGFVSSATENPYFTENDVDNGDIVSLYVFANENSNLSSLELELLMEDESTCKGTKIEFDSSTTNTWIRLTAIHTSDQPMSSINLNYVTLDEQNATFFVDDIQVTYGEKVLENEYAFDDESLFRTYQDYFKIGTCMSSRMASNSMMRKIIKDNFNSITAENEAKPEQILDQEACKELAKTDNTQVAITIKPFERIYDFAEANHIGVRHHTFVWYSQTPGWFFKDNYDNSGKQASKELMLLRMENFIRVTLEAINNRWPGLVYAIDVANEAVENHRTRTNNNNWYTVVGDDFVYYAFKYASMYKQEGQKLYYNDFSFDYDIENCRYALEHILKDAIAENLINGVGIQGHLDSNANMDNVITDAKMIYEKGLECQVTEIDITINGSDQNNLNNQKQAYKNLVSKIIRSNLNQETSVNAVVIWGVTDNTSWKQSQNPLLFNNSYGKKPAYYGFLEAINEI